MKEYFENHVLEKVSHTIGTTILVSTPSINPHAHSGRLTALHSLCGHSKAIAQSSHTSTAITGLGTGAKGTVRDSGKDSTAGQPQHFCSGGSPRYHCILDTENALRWKSKMKHHTIFSFELYAKVNPRTWN
jgi:hypothetical protein